jgi:hypothetical protein
MPVRALGKGGSGANYDIMQAVRYAAGLENDSGTFPPQKADIINLSLSGTNESVFEQYIYDEVRAEGIIVVAAAGNNASSQPVYPAAYNGVLAVSGVDINEQRASYSNFGLYVDLAAPGGDLSDDKDGDGYRDGVLSTAASVDLIGNLSYGYSYLEGTSMAAAHASGVIALMKAVNPALTPDELDELKVDGRITQDLGDPGRDDLYGYGLIDAQKAVLAAAPALLTVSPASLDFGTELSSADLTVDKIGPGLLTILSVTDNAAWLSIEKDPAVGDGAVPARYRVQVDRAGLPPGDYGASISFESDNNTVNVLVTMKASATNLTVDPKSLDFSTEQTSEVLTVNKKGTDLITVQSVFSDVDWLVIDKINPGVGASGDFPVQYRVQANRTGLNSGAYNATITIESDSNQVDPVEIPVTMQVAAPPILTVSPGSIFLGTTLSSTDLTVGKEGPGSITFSPPEVDVTWLEIEAIGPVTGEPPAQYRVRADRTGLDPGEYEATITFESKNNTVEVSVVMQVADVADVADSALYVQLINPDSFKTVYRQTVLSEAGLYRFSFAGVAAGRYLIFAGTNLDNDALIGDAGEVNGAYLSLAQPVTLQVDQNLSGLNFDTGFNLILSAQASRASASGHYPEFIPAF